MRDIVLFILVIAVLGLGYLFIKEEQVPGGNPFSPATPAYTFDTSDPAVIIVTATPLAGEHEVILVSPMSTATVAPTATPYPTYTAVPAQTFGDYGLPGMGPYTLDQVNQCRDIITGGNLHTLQSPQRELCVQYVGVNN